MLKKHLGTLFLVTCLILTTLPTVLGSESTEIVTVTGDGSGEYNCDGSSDQIQINQALEYAATNSIPTVYLKGSFTYYIADPILLRSGVTLTGDSTAIIKLASGLSIWGGSDSSIANEKVMLMIKDNSATNVTIENITVDGSQSDYYSGVELGTSCYNMATLIGVNRLTFRMLHSRMDVTMLSC
jgi:hypothetical protein